MKRVFVKAVLMLLVLALPAVACGQTVRQTVTENGRIRETLVTFAEAPQAIRDLMNGHGLGDARCVCGAALEQEAMAGSTDIAGLPWTSSALMVVERGGAGANVQFIARNIMDAYITIRGYSDTSEEEMTLLK